MFQSAPGRSTRNQLDPLLAAQFEILFGEEPPVSTTPEGRKLRSDWEYHRRYFEGFAVPYGSIDQIEAASDDFEFYGFGRPTFFSFRGRILARFESNAMDVNPDAASVVMQAGQTIAAMQVERIMAGVKVDPVHPMVPGKFQRINSELP